MAGVLWHQLIAIIPIEWSQLGITEVHLALSIGDWITIIFLGLLALGILVAGVHAYFRPSIPRDPSHGIYFKRKIFTRPPLVQFHRRFMVQQQLAGCVELVNKERFREKRLLDESEQERLFEQAFDEFHTKFIDEAWKFFRIEWWNPRWAPPPPLLDMNPPSQDGSFRGNTLVIPYQVVRKGGQLQIERDLGAAQVLTRAKDHLIKLNNDFVFRFLNYQVGIWEENIIDDNFRMIPDEVYQKVLEDDRYRVHDESVMVAALKKWLDTRRELWGLFRPPVTYSRGMVTLTTEGDDTVQKFHWEFNQGYKGDPWHILGFRREGDYFPDRFSETNNGGLVVDDYLDGSDQDPSLKPDTYYSYTFFVKNEKTGEKYQSIRFSIRTPTEEERRNVEHLAKKLQRYEETEGRKATKETQRDEKLRDLEFQSETETLLLERMQEEIDRVKQTEAFKRLEPQRQDGIVENIKNRYHNAMTQLK